MTGVVAGRVASIYFLWCTDGVRIEPEGGVALSLREGRMALEALWAITFGTGQDEGAGVIVFETGRLFGGDTSFYYVGRYEYNTRDQTITGEVEVVRHVNFQRFIFPDRDGGHIRVSGRFSEPNMTLTGHLVEDPRQRIEVHCRHLVDLP
jgi:hypothetical protein